MIKSKKPIVIFASIALVITVCFFAYGSKTEHVFSIPKMFGMSIDKAEKINEQHNMSIITEDSDGNDGITAFDKVVIYESETDIPSPRLIGISVDNVASVVQQYDLTYVVKE